MKNEIIIENGWDSKLSVYKRINDRKDSSNIKISGRYVHHNAIFEFPLKTQKSGEYLLRGSIRAIDNSGNVLKKTGNKAKEILSKLPEEQQLRNNPKLDIRSNIYSNSLDDENIKKQICNSVQKLYSANSIRINEHLQLAARPEIITPNMAAQQVCASYLNCYHQDASLETRTKIDKRIKNLCAKLPPIPMKDIRKSFIKKWINDNSISDEAVRELSRFWTYCVESGTCLGINPIERPKKRRIKSGEAKQYAAARRTSLDQIEQERLFEVLIKENNDYAVGAALMASGFDASFITNLKCKDVIVKNYNDNYVVIRNINNRTPAATKDYTRPMAPKYASIVKEQVRKIQNDNLEQDISEMYLLRNSKSKTKPMNASRLVQEVTRMIIASGVSYTTIAYLREEDKMIAAATKLLKNTYKTNILYDCNLESDPGTASFLLGKSFGADVTSDSYTSFTSPAGEKRLKNILRVLDIPSYYKNIERDYINEGKIYKRRKPKRNNETLDCTIEITLQPGEECKLESEHGIIGEIITKENEYINEQLSLKI
ncbi:MAG: hypothetical protein MJ244_02400 [Clostridia bacterium]|nr:hypothetical protein [Clostridia bacterium]